MFPTLSAKAQDLLGKLGAFMQAHVYPNEQRYRTEHHSAKDRWHVPPIVEDLKQKARDAGLWNLFLPESELGAGLTNFEYADLAQALGPRGWAAERCNRR